MRGWHKWLYKGLLQKKNVKIMRIKIKMWQKSYRLNIPFKLYGPKCETRYFVYCYYNRDLLP